MARAPNVILVHGAWADGSSWSKVIPLLLARGLAVTAVQLPLTSPKDHFAQDLTATEQAVIFVTQAPTAAAALGGNVSAPAWRAKPSWYLVATHDRAIQPDLERRMARAIKAMTIEVAASHAAILARP